ncbi:MAG: hypothetical protein M1834_006401 [Cirrosporium novae-zelandiae]|nr:MAG: hypothetical protein M1834_006401 [Cirrosporium novae-zelandiae]
MLAKQDIEKQAQRAKVRKLHLSFSYMLHGMTANDEILQLAQSYQQLLDEFSSKDLRSVGNYTLGRLIGKGSFGKVYLATHKLTNGSKVVLKSSNKEDGNLAREIHHHRQFLHPHITRLYEVIVTEKLVWLVLEYCPGDELYTYLLNHGPLPVEKVQRIFTQLVGAVCYVHSKSCVHRDLKLENILLDKHENVKLCDFGFTREYEGKTNYLQTFCGTVCYSAPEMLKGEKYAGEKVDVWSLGIILFALLAGELPWDEDNDNDTKARILNEDPSFSERFPVDAKDLISKLLSKRPLMRPALFDVLNHPFLSEFAPQQQAILKLSQPAPFTTQLEKDTLHRMKSAGVNIDQVIENVLAQRCDPLAGWWALLLEKEDRKEKRRERKRKEKEAEAKTLRRLSTASSRLDRMAPTLADVHEEEHGEAKAESTVSRGRRKRRSIPTPSIVVANDLPNLPEGTTIHSPNSPTPPPPIEKDPIRSTSSSRHRPPLPPKERRVSRNSTLHVVSSNPDLLSPLPRSRHSNNSPTTPTRRHQRTIMNQLASIKQWFVESAKRARSPGNTSKAGLHSHNPPTKFPPSSHSHHNPHSAHGRSPHRPVSQNMSTRRRSSANTLTPTTGGFRPNHSRSSTTSTTATNRPRLPNRTSLSPSPLTPHSSYRRTSTGLRGRKSTSSSVSSIRSIRGHTHTHSKASSTSSNSIRTTHSSSIFSRPSSMVSTSRSPHSSVKVLPATPTTSYNFPTSVRLVRSPPVSAYNEAAPFFQNNTVPGSPNLVFARRKKSPFKGPVLHVATSNLSSTNTSGAIPNLPNYPPFAPGGGSSSLPRNGKGRARESSIGSRSNAASTTGRRSGEVIVEEEEEEDEEGEWVEEPEEMGNRHEEEVEEVEAFSPVGLGETAEILEEENMTVVAGKGKKKG